MKGELSAQSCVSVAVSGQRLLAAGGEIAVPAHTRTLLLRRPFLVGPSARVTPLDLAGELTQVPADEPA